MGECWREEVIGRAPTFRLAITEKRSEGDHYYSGSIEGKEGHTYVRKEEYEV